MIEETMATPVPGSGPVASGCPGDAGAVGAAAQQGCEPPRAADGSCPAGVERVSEVVPQVRHHAVAPFLAWLDTHADSATVRVLRPAVPRVLACWRVFICLDAITTHLLTQSPEPLPLPAPLTAAPDPERKVRRVRPSPSDDTVGPVVGADIEATGAADATKVTAVRGAEYLAYLRRASGPPDVQIAYLNEKILELGALPVPDFHRIGAEAMIASACAMIERLLVEVTECREPDGLSLAVSDSPSGSGQGSNTRRGS